MRLSYFLKVWELEQLPAESLGKERVLLGEEQKCVAVISTNMERLQCDLQKHSSLQMQSI
jgi:hypothetical protein